MRHSRGKLLLCAVAGLALSSGAAMAETEVTFQLNDAMVKDQSLAGVAIQVSTGKTDTSAVEAVTDASGRAVLELSPGKYFASYALTGYVPIENSPFRVDDSAKTITTTMSMMLEAEAGGAAHRIRIILNWGSNKRDHVWDADAHFLCTRENPPTNIHFSSRQHTIDDHAASLDVDDIDWGGPETITLSDPKPGTYYYWVHNYSGRDRNLGESEVVVRVLIDDVVAGEYPIPQSIVRATWRPFKELVVDLDGKAMIVDFPESERQLASAELPPGGENPFAEPPGISPLSNYELDLRNRANNDGGFDFGTWLRVLIFVGSIIGLGWLASLRRH